jgi:phospholipase/lecithinase/hemolysin
MLLGMVCAIACCAPRHLDGGDFAGAALRHGQRPDLFFGVFMNFKGLGLRAIASLALCSTLASCGGGDIIEPFAPTRIIAFGDEASVIGVSGTAKYTINGADCAANPIWLQTVATYYGLALPGCLGTATSTTSVIQAAPGAKVADLATQAARVTDWNATTLATVMIGTNDIKDIFASYLADTTSKSARLDDAVTRGKAVATQVTNIVNAGGRVLVLTVPNLGISPYGLAQSTADKAVLTEISDTFNLAIRTNIPSSGYKVGLIKPDELFQQLINVNTTFTNYTAAACPAAAALPACSTSTTDLASTWATYLWADSTQPTPLGHYRVGLAAVTLLARLPL